MYIAECKPVQSIGEPALLWNDIFFEYKCSQHLASFCKSCIQLVKPGWYKDTAYKNEIFCSVCYKYSDLCSCDPLPPVMY